MANFSRQKLKDKASAEANPTNKLSYTGVI